MSEREMDAVVVEEPAGPLVLRRLDVPRPGPGEVLVRVAASPINPSDLGFIAGSYSTRPVLPVVPGFEGSGTVVGAGTGLLPRLLKRRRVAFAAARGGAWAEFLVLPAARCIPVGGALSLEQAAMLVVNPMTALAFFEIARRGRHRAIVSDAAASALGRMILRLGNTHGVGVINVVRRPEQAAELRSLGAEHVLLDAEADFEERLRDLSLRLQATLVLDAVGGQRTKLLVDASPPRSTIVAYSLLSGEPSVFDARRLIGDDKQIQSFYLGHWTRRRGPWRRLLDVRKLRSLAASHLQTRVHARFPLSAANDAAALYRSAMSAGKVLLVADPASLDASARDPI